MFVLAFAIKLKDINYKRNLMKIDVRFEYVPWKMFNFVSFSLLGFTLVNNIFDFEINWNNLIFFDKKYMTSDLNMSYRETADLVSFPSFGFTLFIKLRNADFENLWNTLNTLILFDNVRFEYIPKKNVCCCFICLGSL